MYYSCVLLCTVQCLYSIEYSLNQPISSAKKRPKKEHNSFKYQAVSYGLSSILVSSKPVRARDFRVDDRSRQRILSAVSVVECNEPRADALLHHDERELGTATMKAN